MSFPAHPPSDSPYAPSRPPSSSTSIGASVRASRRLRPQSRENSRPQTAPVQPTLVSPTTVAAAAAAGGGKLTSREAAQHVEHREMTTTHAQVRKSSVIRPVTCPHDLRCMVLELACVVVPGFGSRARFSHSISWPLPCDCALVAPLSAASAYSSCSAPSRTTPSFHSLYTPTPWPIPPLHARSSGYTLSSLAPPLLTRSARS